MASRNSIAALFTFAVLFANAMAVEHWVGDTTGWTLDFDYQAWAKDKVFHVGDTLVFKYNKDNHNVIKVNGTDFKECTAPPANEVLRSGQDAITLATPGKKWYICGVPTHCGEHKMKLVINVVEGAAPAPSPIPNAPSPIPNAPPPIPIAAPPSNIAHGIVLSKYQVFVAAVLALAMVWFY